MYSSLVVHTRSDARPSSPKLPGSNPANPIKIVGAPPSRITSLVAGDRIETLLRKPIAQVGVILYIASTLASIIYPFIAYSSGWLSILPIAFFSSGIFVLVFASVLPSSEGEKWGSMWPLVGYDNAIDAIYTRGPWWMRFEELEEQERERRTVEGMQGLFGTT
jgi:hypothetical protein